MPQSCLVWAGMLFFQRCMCDLGGGSGARIKSPYLILGAQGASHFTKVTPNVQKSSPHPASRQSSLERGWEDLAPWGMWLPLETVLSWHLGICYSYFSTKTQLTNFLWIKYRQNVIAERRIDGGQGAPCLPCICNQTLGSSDFSNSLWFGQPPAFFLGSPLRWDSQTQVHLNKMLVWARYKLASPGPCLCRPGPGPECLLLM